MTAARTDARDLPPRVDCSRAGCREAARWRVEWRNPRIHAEDRRKVWIACDDHRDFLREYLAARDFPVAVFPLETGGAGVPS